MLQLSVDELVLQLRADELQRRRNATQNKLIFLVLDENILSGIQYSNILIENLEISYCQSLAFASNSNSIAEAVDNAARSLGINRTLTVFYCLIV